MSSTDWIHELGCSFVLIIAAIGIFAPDVIRAFRRKP